MQPELSEFKIKQDICTVGKTIYEKGLVTANDGNISVKVGPDQYWVTPTGVSKNLLKPDMLIKVNGNGDVLSGRLKPTSEIKMHLGVYRENPEIRAVVHAHPPFATAFAVAGIPLDQALMPESIVLLGTIPVAEYGTPSTEELSRSVAKYVGNHQGVLLENHGALTWGKNLTVAANLMESLEFYAKINWIARQMGGNRELSTERVAQLVDLKKKMGIPGATPSGVPCRDELSACLPRPPQHADKSDHLSNEQLEQIVARVTAAVLKQLKPGKKE